MRHGVVGATCSSSAFSFLSLVVYSPPTAAFTDLSHAPGMDRVGVGGFIKFGGGFDERGLEHP